VFDCGAVAPTLVESEIFGHVKGAFTGAVDSRPGVFEQANGGTIFLDELGELPKSLQPKLLRVLEKREIRRLGSTRSVPIDVRLVAATNRNLEAEIHQRNFREDLFYRVSAAHLVLPALRDRREDLELLVTHFLTQMNPDLSGADVPCHIWEMFKTHRWPGNVRELRNAVQRMLVTPERLLLRGARTNTTPSTAEQFGTILPLPEARRQATDQFEVNYLKAVLGKAGGHVPRAAAVAAVSRQMIQKLLRKHGLNVDGEESDE
jgi:transcriptional regulator with PAS, ATPase and Fis domain